MTTYAITDYSIANKTFYGYTINAQTGRLTISVINDGSQVDIPSDYVITDNQYRTWIWSKNTLQFRWSSTKNTHLLMEIL